MISERITLLRQKHLNECSTLKKEHEKTIAALEAELARVKAVDYAAPYRNRYIDFCNVMEEYYQKILKAEKDIHGLDFYSDKYMPKAVVLPRGDKHVEDFFEFLVNKCGETIKALDSKHTVAEYAGLLRTYCDLLATMRYVVKNNVELLAKCPLPIADKTQKVGEVTKRINHENEKYGVASKLENLKCYPEMVALGNDLNNTYEKSISELLGAVDLGDDGMYKYLVGYRVEKISNENAEFCEKIVGVGRERIGREPIYTEACTNKANLVINAPEDFLASKTCYNIICNIYFSVASRVDKNMLQFGCIECTKNRAVVRSIYTSIDTESDGKKLLGDYGKFCYDNINTNDPADVMKYMNRINTDCNDTVNKFDNLKEYNLKTTKNKEPLKMVAVNLYPDGFIDPGNQNEQAYTELQRIMKEFGDSGTFFVVCQNTSNPALAKSGIKINAGACNAIELTLTDESYNAWKKSGKNLPLTALEFTIDGKTAVIDIAVSKFNEDDYWKELKSFYSPKEVFDTESKDVIKKSDIPANYCEHQPPIFENGAIEISLGQFSGASL